MFKIESADQKVLELLRAAKRFDYYRLADVKSHQVYDYQKGEASKPGEPML